MQVTRLWNIRKEIINNIKLFKKKCWEDITCTVRCQPGSRGRVQPLKCVSCVFYCSACSPTCKQKQDSVVFAVGCLDPLDSQVAVGVFSRHHGQVPSNCSHTVICQEVLFDKAQGIVWGVVQATLTQKLTQTNYFCIHFHLCGTFLNRTLWAAESVPSAKLLPAHSLNALTYLGYTSACGSRPLHPAHCYVAHSYMFQIWTALWNVK